MGLLVDGVWRDHWYNTAAHGGRFVREDAQFRHAVSEGGPFPVEVGRYHLYVAMACPWAHRVMVVRALYGLQSAVSVSVVHSDMLEHGWCFDDAHPDHLYGHRYLHEVYCRSRKDYSGRVTVPVLWDKHAEVIVNNESSELIRMFYGPLARLGRPDAPLAGHDLYPVELREEIDSVNADVYAHLNNGVYRAGFATSQDAYDDAVEDVFACLDRVESRLRVRPWLCGSMLTEADIRLFTTAVRFDAVYHSHFKCSRARLTEYPNLWEHTRAIAQLPGVAATIDMKSIRRHYFFSHASINPTRIVPVSPRVDLWRPHERGSIR